MRLFVIWYQILMDNATEECHTIYSSLVPKLSQNPTDIDIFTKMPESKGSRKICASVTVNLGAASE